jgi:hypothetical protein
MTDELPPKKEPGKPGRKKTLKVQGRPRWKPSLRQVEELASLGLNNRQICQVFAISEETFYKKLRESPSFSEAIAKGRGKTVTDAATSLKKQSDGGNVNASIYLLKSRGQWRDDGSDLKEPPKQSTEPESLDTNEARDRTLQKLADMENALSDQIIEGSKDAISLMLKLQNERAKLLGLYPRDIDRVWSDLETYGYERSQTTDGYHLRDITLPPVPPPQPSEEELQAQREERDRQEKESYLKIVQVRTIELEEHSPETTWGLPFDD